MRVSFDMVIVVFLLVSIRDCRLLMPNLGDFLMLKLNVVTDFTVRPHADEMSAFSPLKGRGSECRGIYDPVTKLFRDEE